MKTQRSADIMVGWFVTLLGVFVIIASTTIRGGAPHRLPPQTFPMVVGFLLLICGIGLAFKAWRLRGADLKLKWPDREGFQTILVSLASLGCFIALMDPPGLPLASFVYIAFSTCWLQAGVVPAARFGVPMTLHDLPTLNATLNAGSAVFLVAGWILIRSKQVPAHRACMVAALVTSCLFLVSYLVYHAQVGSVRFQSQGWIRPLYFTVLLTHTVLAAAIVPLVVITLRRALRRAFPRHRRLARWTFPLWLYVSLTGVLIYWLLYHVDRR